MQLFLIKSSPRLVSPKRPAALARRVTPSDDGLSGMTVKYKKTIVLPGQTQYVSGMETHDAPIVKDDLKQAVWVKRWLWLAVWSLALAGLFSVVLVIARTPGLSQLPYFKELFGVSLVIHVDLSVLVWFLSLAATLWAWLRHKVGHSAWPYTEQAAWGTSLAGMLLMAAAVFHPDWEVIKSNYVPVIVNPLFFLGLGLFTSGIIISLWESVRAFSLIRHIKETHDKTIAYGVGMSLCITMIALAAFLASHEMMPEEMSGISFYEHLFWAGGHVLQFTYTQVMLIAWLVLAAMLGCALPHAGVQLAILSIGPVVVLSSFLPYLLYEVTDHEHQQFFTWQMNIAGGVAGGLLGLYFLPQLERLFSIKKEQRALRGALLMSFLLFIVGGAFSVAIDGPNVRIPAHYHGSIVAVTLALLGLAYALLPALGAPAVANWRMARIQPYCYGIGQLLHISGLAISGGYGVMRKTPGEVDEAARVAMGVMGLGGLLAIIGGLLFVVVMVKALAIKNE